MATRRALNPTNTPQLLQRILLEEWESIILCNSLPDCSLPQKSFMSHPEPLSSHNNSSAFPQKLLYPPAGKPTEMLHPYSARTPPPTNEKKQTESTKQLQHEPSTTRKENNKKLMHHSPRVSEHNATLLAFGVTFGAAPFSHLPVFTPPLKSTPTPKLQLKSIL